MQTLDPAPVAATPGGVAEHGYRADIDGLRAVAIGLVVLFHAGVPWFQGGYVGVDVFFALSGFLITGLLLRQASGGHSLVRFYANRARRLLPMSSLVLLTSIVIGVLLVAPVRRAELFGDIRAALFYVANWRFAGKSVAYSDATVADSLVTHFWSLSIEEQYYFVWPLLVVLAVKARSIAAVARRVELRHLVGGAAAVLTVVSLWWSWKATPEQGSRAYYLTHLRVWELSAGALLACIYAGGRRWRIPFGGLLQAAALVAIVWSAVGYDRTTPFPGLAALVPVGATLVILAVGSGSTTPVGQALSVRPMRFVGRISYSWYLWHWPALGVAALLVVRHELDTPTWVTRGGAVLVSFLLAWLCNVTIESPVRHSAWLQRRARRSLGLAVVTTLVVATVGVVAMNNTDDGTAVAAGLTMSPAEAAADRSDPMLAGCLVAPATGHHPIEWCQFGDPNGTTAVALVGDSHAAMWAPAFDEAARAKGWKVYATMRSACLVYPVNIFYPRLNKIYDDCRAWEDDLAAAIDDLGDVDAVVVGRAQYGLSALRDDAGNKVTKDQAVEILRDASAAFFTAVSAIGVAPIVLGDSPPAGQNPPTCLSEATPPITPETCEFDPVATQELDVVMHDAELIGAERAGLPVTFMDFDDLVCPTNPCPVITETGLIKFADGAHLTTTFVRTLSNDVAARLGDALVAVGAGRPD